LLPQQNAGGRGLGSLAQKWNISDPTFDYEGLQFTLVYAVSSFIADDMGTYTITDGEDCVIPVLVASDEGNQVGFAFYSPGLVVLSSSAAKDNSGDSIRSFKLDIKVNPEEISNNAVVYKEDVVNGEIFGRVAFCVRFQLNTPGGSSIEVNFLETIVQLNVDLTDGFSIGTVAVAPKDRLTTTANEVYEVQAFQCNTLNAPITTTFNQGQVIRICISPVSDALNDGVNMRDVQSFTFTRDEIEQIAVENNDAASNGLTSLECIEGEQVCWFETLLKAEFYASPGAVAGSGIATMRFGQPQRRLQTTASRALQEEPEVAGAAEFTLDFSVNGAADDKTGSGAPISSGFLGVTFLAFTGALALL
jgi:hypothetical protein